MRRSPHASTLATATVAALVTGLALTGGPPAAADPGGGRSGHGGPGDVRDTGPDYNNGKAKPLDLARSERAKTPPVKGPAKIGTTKIWPADDDTDSIYLKNYTLRGIGEHIEVWVANDTTFPPGDCRNTLGLTEVTDAQVAGFVHEFDTNIYPKESEAFSVAPTATAARRRSMTW